jgi:hypothetical protein
VKIDRLIQTKLLGRPYRSSNRRFEEERRGILRSASIVAGHVLDVMPVRSVIDVGCGVGLWLKAFSERGVENVVGVDGDYTDRSRLEIDAACFIGRDLNAPLHELALGRFDLAMSLEVGEHLLPARADSLVDDLCSLSDLVMYGAAIERQGGEQHINEQWQSYWVNKFLSRDYLAYDVLRPAIWSDPAVNYWYKQNTILYVKRGSAAHAVFAKRFPVPSTAMFDLVHPELYWRNLNSKRGLRRLEKNVRRILSQLTGLPLLNRRKPIAGDAHLTRQREPV